MTRAPEPYKRRRGTGLLVAESYVTGWGFNYKGQLGTGWWGSNSGSFKQPLPVESQIRNVDCVSCGNFMAAALIKGRIAFWGASQYAQLCAGHGPEGLWNGRWEKRITYVKGGIALLGHTTYISRKDGNHENEPGVSPEWWETAEEAGIASAAVQLKTLAPEEYVIREKNFVEPNFSPQLSNVKAMMVFGVSGGALLNNGEIRMWGYNQYGTLGTAWDQDFGPKPRPLKVKLSIFTKEANATGTAGTTELTNFKPRGSEGNPAPKVGMAIFDEAETFTVPTKITAVVETSPKIWTVTIDKPLLKSIAGTVVFYVISKEEYFWPEVLQNPNWPVTPRGTTGKKFTYFVGGNNATSHPLVLAVEEGTGQVWGWGDNTRGQILGVPKELEGPNAFRDEPVKLYEDAAATKLLKGITALATNGVTVLAIKEGKLFGWGTNNKNGLSTSIKDKTYNEPVSVYGLENVVAVAIGRESCYAIINGAEEGELYAWGNNSRGQLGLGTITPASEPHTPTRVGTFKEVNYIHAGVYTTAIKIKDKMYIWGANKDGNVGDGTLVDKGVPYQVPINGVKTIALTEFISLAVTDQPTIENPVKPWLNVNSEGDATLSIVWKYTPGTKLWNIKYKRTPSFEANIREEEEEAAWRIELEEFEETGGKEGISPSEFEQKQKEQQEAAEGVLTTTEIFPTEIEPGVYSYTWSAPEPISESLSYLVKLQNKTVGNTFGLYVIRTESMWANS